MDWVAKPQIIRFCINGILQLFLLQPLLKTLKLDWVAFHSVKFPAVEKYLDFKSNQYKKLFPVLSRFCNPPLLQGKRMIFFSNGRWT